MVGTFLHNNTKTDIQNTAFNESHLCKISQLKDYCSSGLLTMEPEHRHRLACIQIIITFMSAPQIRKRLIGSNGSLLLCLETN